MCITLILQISIWILCVTHAFIYVKGFVELYKIPTIQIKVLAHQKYVLQNRITVKSAYNKLIGTKNMEFRVYFKIHKAISHEYTFQIIPKLHNHN